MSMQGSFSVRWQGITIVDAVVSYAISASNEYAPSNGWSPIVVKTTKDMPYLWTRIVTTYNDGSTNTAYSVSRQGTDGSNGTSFTPQGVALGHYSDMSSLLASIKSFSIGDKYILDKCSGGSNVNLTTSKPCVVVYMDAPDYTWYATQADEGNGYNVNGTLYVNNGEKWVDFGDIQGPAGEDGHNLQLIVSPTKVVLDTDNEGNIVNGGYMRFIYAGKFGDEVITDNTPGAEFSISAATNDSSNFYTRFAGLYENKQATQGYFSTDGIKKFEYEVGGQKMYAPATSSFFTINLTYKGFSVSQRVDIVCNLALLNYTFVQDRYRFQSLYEELNKQQVAQGELVKKNQSAIEQNANNIKLSATKSELNDTKGEVVQQIGEVDIKADKVSAKVDDLLDDLEATGIDIVKKKVLVTADNFEVRNNSGKKTMSVDADGNFVTEGTAKIKGGIEAQYGYIGSFTLRTFTDSTGTVFYGLSSSTSGTVNMAPNSISLSNDGIEVRSQYSSALGGIVTIGHGSDKVNDEFNWSNGLVNVSGQFSGSELSAEQAAYNASVYGNAKNTVSCYKADAQGGAISNAFYAKHGDIFAEDGCVKSKCFCGGIGLSTLTLSNSKEYYNNSELDISKNSTWILYASRNNFNKVALPRLNDVRKFANNATTFAIRLTIIAKRGSQQFSVCGRKSSNSYLANSEIPIYLNNDGGDANSVNMASGDVLDLMLVYDGSEYCSYVLNYRN